jgi:hypothetical protein
VRRIAMVTVAALSGETSASALRRAESALHAGAARRADSTRTNRRAVRTRPAPGIGPPRSGRPACLTGPDLRVETVARTIVAALPGAVASPLDRATIFLPVTRTRPAHRQPAWPE